MKEKPQEPPKEGRSEGSRILAFILDDLIPIPGTKARIGLDPIIGLIPGVGDGSTTAVGSYILVQGLNKGVSRIVLIRMAINLLINGIFGAIPILGDLFSAWFKSNQRNYRLLEKHRNGAKKATAMDWIVVIGALVFVIAVAVGLSFLVGLVFYRLLSVLFG
ncbi:DUF4112 domain-containing protein [Puniceicoccus vermicola]|uniref:DUF4112 domain-containing protein n=1 Tax=Puniceicoccus vermicola TaxID=388746 RepID=A0A7X1AWG7_9BACT|nr:DUF4112 domain-containing protein [Puniceicoccus vermicola]MBC2601271.1 DUF4112 domain-containing protein [Puniceicoccus vermicola]